MSTYGRPNPLYRNGEWFWVNEHAKEYGPYGSETSALSAMLRYMQHNVTIANAYAPNPSVPSGAPFVEFLQRYVIERAATFERGKERDQAWLAMKDAETIFRMIERQNELYQIELDKKRWEMLQASNASNAPGQSWNTLK